jgi:hypothetical protein
VMQGVSAPQIFIHPDIAIRHSMAIPVVLIGVDVNIISVINNTMQYGIKFIKPVHILYA